MESQKKTEYRAPALEKGLEILELLATHGEP
ncbi:TPA: IclR family transcriptional regulator, partial [Vibrio vulnificus]|nr:IclR family transcriptional regulator [Vibrio vulnificus]